MSDLIAGRARDIELPSPLIGDDGAVVKNAGEWHNRRRREIIRLCERFLFGRVPPRPASVRHELLRERPDALDGKARRREIRVHMENNGRRHHADALWYIPRQADENNPAPLLLGLNFPGNAGCATEDDIPGEDRGVQARRWPFAMLVERGFSVLTAGRNDFFPDHDQGLPDSVYRLWHDRLDPSAPCGRTAISAWALGASMLLDLALTEPAIDGQRIWHHGHSRLGKAALWASANDPRFAGCVSNDSGTCGAALMHDKIPDAESLASITETLPWWFKPELRRFAGAEDAMPFDMHFLAALTAPRPLLVASASEDRWADPYNEYRAAAALAPVYGLFGMSGLGDASFPEPDQLRIGDGVGYALRRGEHDVTELDWKMVMDFIAAHS